ncbi:MAG: GNAT family N-acetyltransferase [Pseudomonadota bacterium]
MVTVRLVTAADEPDWRRLWTAYLAFYGQNRDDTVFSDTWARILDPDIKMYAQIALADGAPIGLVHYLHHQYFWGPEDRIYLNDLFVDPNRRGNGAGRALIEVVRAHAASTGASDVWWLTAEDNAPARALYDSVANLTPFRQYKL